MGNSISGQLYTWDICALRPANDNESWSYRKSFVFLAASSSIVWAGIGLVVRLAAGH